MNPDVLKLTPGMHILLTITLPNRLQFTSQPKVVDRKKELNFQTKMVYRLKKLVNIYESSVQPLLKKSFRFYFMSTEISEPLSSNGKHFPRLHWHIYGELKEPIYLLFGLGELFSAGLGYHIARLQTEEMKEEKQQYIGKQQAQMLQTIGQIYTLEKLYDAYDEIESSDLLGQLNSR